jgi:hypothetical protein
MNKEQERINNRIKNKVFDFYLHSKIAIGTRDYGIETDQRCYTT